MAVAALIATAGATNGTLFGRRAHGLAGGDRAVSSSARPSVAARQARGPARHGGPRPRSRRIRRPLRDRLGRKCMLARRVPARRARRLSAASEDGRLLSDRSARNRGDRDRARILRRRHAPQRSQTFGAIVGMTLLAVMLTSSGNGKADGRNAFPPAESGLPDPFQLDQRLVSQVGQTRSCRVGGAPGPGVSSGVASVSATARRSPPIRTAAARIRRRSKPHCVLLDFSSWYAAARRSRGRRRRRTDSSRRGCGDRCRGWWRDYRDSCRFGTPSRS